MEVLSTKRGLNDRWIAAVGLLVAGAVAALLGVAVLVAHRVDADSARHEVEITKGHLNAQVARMRQDLASVAHAQNAGQRTIATDLHAIHNDVGRRLHLHLPKRLVARIEEVATRIAASPQIGGTTRKSDFLRFPVGNYLIVYEIVNYEVVVLYVRHSARPRPWEGE